ncbi:MAG: DNA polymerase IV [Mycobacteriaceae bacterium]|nr:DNA polymerase IV [Mycobacteriaceae bacterium]
MPRERTSRGIQGRRTPVATPWELCLYPEVARWLAHVDLDQFQAAVEYRRRPHLRGLPVIVGGNGDPTEPRKVVTCASYPAREFGVRAGMPLRQAARKCPDGVFLALDMATYEAASDEVMTLLRSFPVRLEVLGWDEAFLAADTADPEQLAADIRRAVAELGLSCCVGLGDTKQRAKLATGFAKRGPGIYRLTAANWDEVMADRPTDALWGVGSRIAARLGEVGIRTVAELGAADPRELAAAFGPTTGPYLWLLGRGGGETDVVTQPRAAAGRSKSETFPADLTDRAEIAGHVDRLARELAAEMLDAGRVTVRVAVTVRTKTFYTRTKIRTLPAPTTDADAIAAAALDILGRFELDRPVRLLGVRLELVRATPE